MKQQVDILVIGTGPAGIAAAAEGVRAGLRVAMVDDQASPGGKVFKHSNPRTIDPDERLIRPQLEAALALVRTTGVVLPQTTVYAIGEDLETETYSPLEKAREYAHVTPKTIIVAPGAVDRLIPFPGWHQPGVFSIGGLNTLVKNGILPGRKYVVAGSGPLLPVLAYNLVKAGAAVQAVLDASPFMWYSKLGWALLSQGFWGKAALGLRYLAAVRKAGVPYHYGCLVSQAEGRERVTGVVARRLGGLGGEMRFEADVLAVSYGLLPQTRITQLAGCGHEYRADFGYWQVHRNDFMETTVSNVFAAGDGGAVEGFGSAWRQGQVAGLAAAKHCGTHLEDEAEARLAGLLAKSGHDRMVGQALACLANPGPAPWGLITDDTVICRCEEVTYGQVKAAEGDVQVTDINDLKRRLRIGMGHCQGQICGQNINELLQKASGRSRPVEQISIRPPLAVVPIGRLAE